MSLHALPLHQPAIARPAHRLPPAVRFSRTDRLHLLLALGSALTATTLGVAMALVVLVVVVARGEVRRRLAPSVAAGGGILAAAQDAHLLHAAGEAGQAVARP